MTGRCSQQLQVSSHGVNTHRDEREDRGLTFSSAGSIAPSTTLWNEPHLGTVCAHHCKREPAVRYWYVQTLRRYSLAMQCCHDGKVS